MLYISFSGNENYIMTITNTESGEEFNVNKWGADDKYYCMGDEYDVSTVLGYLKNSICEVDTRLINLLSYIESVDCIECSDEAIVVNNILQIHELDRYNVLFYINSIRHCNIFDIILCASYSERFAPCLKSGKLAVIIGDKCLSIKFCGNYEPYVMKLITVYRETNSYNKVNMWW